MKKKTNSPLPASFATEIKKLEAKLKSEKRRLGHSSERIKRHIKNFEGNRNLYRLISEINGELIKLQNQKISSFSAIEPIITFVEICLLNFKDDFLSTLTPVKEALKKSVEKSQKLKNIQIFCTLLAEAIKLSEVNFEYSQELVSQFEDVSYVYLEDDYIQGTHVYMPSIYYAVALNLFEIIPVLAKRGANPNAIYNHETCLHRLIERRDPNIQEKLDVLISHGANPNLSVLNKLSPLLKAIVFNKELCIKYFEQKDYKPSWSSSLGLANLKSLYDRLEAYIDTEYNQFIKSGKKVFIILVGEQHLLLDSLITVMLVVNICYRLGIKSYYLEQMDLIAMLLGRKSSYIPVPKIPKDCMALMGSRIAQEYGMDIICFDTARTNTLEEDTEEKGMKKRNQDMADNLTEAKKNGMSEIGSGHLYGISARLSRSSIIYHCNINTCGGLRHVKNKSKAIQFMYDETQCFQGYLPQNVMSSQEIILLMKNLVAHDFQDKKLIPLLIENGIFQATPLKSSYTHKRNPSVFGERPEQKASTEISKT